MSRFIRPNDTKGVFGDTRSQVDDDDVFVRNHVGVGVDLLSIYLSSSRGLHMLVSKYQIDDLFVYSSSYTRMSTNQDDRLLLPDT